MVVYMTVGAFSAGCWQGAWLKKQGQVRGGSISCRIISCGGVTSRKWMGLGCQVVDDQLPVGCAGLLVIGRWCLSSCSAIVCSAMYHTV